MRRDVSGVKRTSHYVDGSSLHAQRCFSRWNTLRTFRRVFSACAEMFLSEETGPTTFLRLLCMRRDVSEHRAGQVCHTQSSLHAQRCFSKPVTTSGMTGGLLCMRRDVSYVTVPGEALYQSSLHAQRCFLLRLFGDLPAHSLLCRRRDVSTEM